MDNTNRLLKKIKACTLCEPHLPFQPKPILSFETQARLMIVGQAPGTKAHGSGIPWDDASGDRLRDWLGVTKEQFYNPKIFAIVPMGFCYPGKGKSGDLPPRPECSAKWMAPVLNELKNIEMTILIGAYSQAYFLKEQKSLTDIVRDWQNFQPRYFVLPHPSPRNNIWLKKNAWFEKNLLPQLKEKTQELINS